MIFVTKEVEKTRILKSVFCSLSLSMMYTVEGFCGSISAVSPGDGESETVKFSLPSTIMSSRTETVVVKDRGPVLVKLKETADST